MITARYLVLGAGFSRPAGLPLASELFQLARRRVGKQYGLDNQVERDLRRYLDFVRETEDWSGEEDAVDAERFMSFLDVEHYLRFQGSETWSDEGNKSQLMLRQAIGYVLLERTPIEVPDVYKYFADQLTTSDWVVTFNYDTLLERALESVGKPYRLFPTRLSSVDPSGGIVDHSIEDVVVLKMHGSVDWVNKKPYMDRVAYRDNMGHSYPEKHPVFGPDATVSAHPIVDGPRVSGDPLESIYRVESPHKLYTFDYWECAPFLISPSHSKLLYSAPLQEFWRGMARDGGLCLGFGVVGYSMPPYDDYAVQALYSIAGNYQGAEPDYELQGRKKRPVRILDYRPSVSAKRQLRKRYRFLVKSRTKYWYKGLSRESIDWLMA